MNRWHDGVVATTAILLAVIAGCTPGTSGKAATTARASVTGASVADIEIPVGADLQGAVVDYVGYSSLKNVVAASTAIAVGRVVAIGSTTAHTPPPAPSDLPSYKATAERSLPTSLTWEFRVDDSTKGSLHAGQRIKVTEIGTSSDPLMRPDTTYLLFLQLGPDGSGYSETGGPGQGRYVIEQSGRIGISTGAAGDSFSRSIVGHTLDEARPQLK
jgi:hypothetical protein